MSMLRQTGLGLIGVMLVLALLGPVLATTAPDAQDLARILEPPGALFLLGTDHLGRSVAARLAEGARVSLAVAALASGVAVAIGAVLGIAAASLGSWPAALLRGSIDLVQALPNFLGLLLVATLFPVGPVAIGLAFALIAWVEPARVALLTAETTARSPAVEAARLVALPPHRIARDLLLPPLLPPLAAVGGLLFGQAVLGIAALGFLGLGLRPPSPEWGAMIADSLPYASEAPHLLLAPALAIITTVAGLFLLASPEPAA
jgi:peptide/nickel transport system permease protein